MEAKRLLATTTTNNSTSNSSTSNSSKSNSSKNGTNDTQNVLAQLRLKTLTEATLSEHLHKAVDKYEADSLVQSTLERSHTDSGSGKRRKLFLMPTSRVFEFPLPVPNNSSNGNGEDAIDLTATPDKDVADFQDSDVLLTQDSHPASTSASASGRKRNLTQFSRANTADTVNTYVSTSSTLNDMHRWISLTLLPTGSSGSGKSSAAEGTQLSQAEAVPIVGSSASSINAFILVWFYVYNDCVFIRADTFIEVFINKARA